MRKYLSLVKFAHTIFALPFAAIGFFLGMQSEEAAAGWMAGLLILISMICARNAAMSFNRLTDIQYDKANPRTSKRVLPSGEIKYSHALLFTIINASCFVICTYFINSLCFYLSPVALIIIMGYSYTKRFTMLSHIVLGTGLALAPVGAYVAVTGTFAVLPVLFALSVMCWVAGFDIIYALQDEIFDRRHKLKSIPSLLGREKALLLSAILHLLCFVFLIICGITGRFGFLYWTGCGIFSLLLLYQHLIVKADDLSRVNTAFFTTNGMASVIFSIFVISDLWLI